MITFVANKNKQEMYSSEDLERFYFQYQVEALPHGESLQSFCSRNQVFYNIFHKWYKDMRNKIVEVQVAGIPVDKEVSDSPPLLLRLVSPRLVPISLSVFGLRFA